ncbi:MAG: Radical SAM domain protein [Syntrophaceae bacterium]|nr:MAG: Radical SAM domain protein [Syntrophaceae bacterium]
MVISTLDFASHKNLWNERLTPANQAQYQEMKSLFNKLAREAEKKGIGFFYNLVLPSTEGGTCTENHRQALLVSSDGSVSPCVFNNVPAAGSSCVSEGEEVAYRKLTFGCIADESLPAIWNSSYYREFRKSFESLPHPLCQGCPKRYEESG